MFSISFVVDVNGCTPIKLYSLEQFHLPFGYIANTNIVFESRIGPFFGSAKTLLKTSDQSVKK